MPNELDYAGLDPDEEWSEPTLHGDTRDDFGIADDRQWDELSEAEQREVEDNFLLGEDVDRFGALDLPVVDPEGDLDPSNDQLNKSAVDTADARVMQSEGHSRQTLQETDDRIQKLQRKFE